MKIDDVLALAKAGFNFNQISQLAQLARLSNPAQTPANPQTSPANPVTTAPQNIPETQQTPANPQTMPAAFDQNKLVNDLVAQLQQSNILGSQQPATETADDVLAQIINPKGVENNGGK